jgi:DNA repair exonuclease SbcCD nuclease subunit
LKILIIPGNHDPFISTGTFSLRNLQYITQPQLIDLDNNLPFVFIPYEVGSSIGEILASNSFPVQPNNWCLVSHCDWLSRFSLQNKYESGTYMPLSDRDILAYKPTTVFLGHIHVPIDTPIVHYPGSPCGINPTENGLRSFLVFDTLSRKTTRIIVESDFIFLNETITIIPLSDEDSYVKKVISERINSWNLEEKQREKVRLRINAQGFSSNRENLIRVIRDCLQDYQFTDDNQPDVSKVNLSNDMMRSQIAESVQSKTGKSNFQNNIDEPTVDEILFSAMNIVYGGKK